jgi:dolichol-phosphate mannosyltransferase
MSSSMKLSVVIPARDEAGSVGNTVSEIVDALAGEGIDYEILVIDDGSSDGTFAVISRLAESDERIRCIRSSDRNGFGFAVRAGLEQYTGDSVAIMMADGSDSPEDLLTYHRLLTAGYGCAFGSRFIPGGGTHRYPLFKLVVNRIVNIGIRLAFGYQYNDTTNAFKAYRREVIDNVQPLISRHFNLTVEIPLKAIVRGHSYAITPINWSNRTTGTSKLRLQEMGSRYLFIVLYVFFEHHLSKGDYRVADQLRSAGRAGWRAGGAAVHPAAEPAVSIEDDGGSGCVSATPTSAGSGCERRWPTLSM